MGPFLNLSKFLERAVGPPLPCNHLQNLNVPTAVTLWELPSKPYRNRRSSK